MIFRGGVCRVVLVSMEAQRAVVGVMKAGMVSMEARMVTTYRGFESGNGFYESTETWNGFYGEV